MSQIPEPDAGLIAHLTAGADLENVPSGAAHLMRCAAERIRHIYEVDEQSPKIVDYCSDCGAEIAEGDIHGCPGRPRRKSVVMGNHRKQEIR